MYTDLDADFPTFSIINLKGIGPVFTTGGGSLNIAATPPTPPKPPTP